MASRLNETIPLFRPGADLTGHVTSAVTGGRFVKPSANSLQSGPGLASTAEGGNYQIAPATAGQTTAAFGVAVYDGAVGDKIPVIRGAGTIVPMIADGAIAVGVEVEVGTAGKPRTLASGRAVGWATTAAADTATVYISLY